MDLRSPFVVSLHDLPRSDGSLMPVRETFAAPADMGIELMTVPTGSELDVDLSLTSVSEGVYIGGQVHFTVAGQCSRCLREIHEERTQDVSDLAYYPQRRAELIAEGDEDAEEHPVIEDDHVDLEPVLRDAIVLNLPFQPLCSPTCQGLCAGCGERLEDLPEGHHHEAPPLRSDALDALEAQLRAQE
ncbi:MULTISPECIES: YceD family protein [Actinotignum]|uniref:YceD family protein n=1 Tax=Actinotignum timonense TaxID=1870995 RepID=A0AAW9HLW4_9ACTO|nr:MULTISPECIES: YceD family protein [Actinotignum]MDE1557804.1 YceD family protein [Actinotignum schaalii]MDE1663696.1 YceD family protein [Actinotignum schaalii]MDK6374110.1 YceD family protein [Actinotignum timonense]MDK6590983.1 YceD family protein [Actinotignum timonense]MDK6644402.1 YceD family protein [Actinotignum timonense]